MNNLKILFGVSIVSYVWYTIHFNTHQVTILFIAPLTKASFSIVVIVAVIIIILTAITLVLLLKRRNSTKKLFLISFAKVLKRLRLL